ncbi:protein kinase family protein [Streptomyces cinereoruber]|uniref:serine/threonine protein kinase n=1 Tax=Streptomyces cinereoruber TaxID=67260 RepID=UPI00363C5CDD
MDDYAGRVLADRYRLPLPPADEAGDAHDPTETRAFDTYSGQEVLVRQVPLPEFVDAEVLDGAGPGGSAGLHGGAGRATRRPAEPVVRRAIEAAQAAAQIPDHPLLDQVFDVFAEAGSLWIVSERVAEARPLAALLAERPLNPYRAAEIGADVLTALRALHAHGWVHRNITSRTVLVCDDGRVVLSGLAVGAAEEALCGYAPIPERDRIDEFAYSPPPHETEEPAPETYEPGVYEAETYEPGTDGAGGDGPEAYGPETYEPETYEPGAYGPGGYELEADGPGAGESGAYGSGAYALETYTPGAYEPEVYAPESHRPEPYTPERPAPAEEYGSDPYGSGGYGPRAYGMEEYEAGGYGSATHGSEEHRPEEHRPEAHRPEPHAPYALEAPEGAGRDDDGADDGPDDTPGASPGPGSGPDAYGTDPYGKSTATPAGTRPAATPPTADVRAARAGAIAAYRAGARAAARLGETGALPVQRPAPPEPTGPPPPPPTAPAAGSPEPQWWARVADDDEDDEDDGDEPYGGPRNGPPPRAMLTGSWSDGPHAARDGSGPIPAGGGSVLPGSGRPALPAGYRAAHPDPERLPVHAGVPEPRREDSPEAPAESYRGPTTRLAAERARQTRIAVVGAVTERWAPEQAGPVHENWRLAAPIGPATDLWALGALLYRAVQGHAPYPEDSAAELVQLVCAEPPAFAEESGPLRPVVESLLRQDPTERPDFEELRGWLRSLVRSAPEPDAGVGVVPLPSFDEARLPIVRRRGELVRRRRKGEGAGRRRHKRGREPHAAVRHESERTHASEYAHVREHARVRDDFREEADGGYHEELPQRAPRAPRAPRASSGSPRALGLKLLLLILLLLVAAVAYAVLFLPGEGETPAGRGTPTAGPAPGTTAPGGAPDPTADGPSANSPSGSRPPATTAPATTRPPADPSAPALAAGYALRQDPEGFRIGVPDGWRRSPINDSGQVRYTGGGFTMIVVPGRDSVRDNGSDPLVYQNARERELEPWRASSWSGAERTLRVDIGSTATATGSYWWLDGTGREVFVRNLALIDGGRYHVVQVIGPYTERDKVSEIYEEATKAFRPGR